VTVLGWLTSGKCAIDPKIRSIAESLYRCEDWTITLHRGLLRFDGLVLEHHTRSPLIAAGFVFSDEDGRRRESFAVTFRDESSRPQEAARPWDKSILEDAYLWRYVHIVGKQKRLLP
jgi:hypothetical protein